MQCQNCHFENIPGVGACGRCGGSLKLATAVIDVHPPRAGRWSKRVGSIFPRRLVYRARDAAGQVGAGLTQLPVGDLPESAVVWRMVVPGWPQLYLGQKLLGRTLLGAYLLLLCLGLAFIGTFLGSLCLGLAVACHTASIIDTVTAAVEDVGHRIALGATCIAALGLVVYFPGVRLVSRVLVPQVIVRDVPPFKAGDVVLYAPARSWWRALAPGDVVLYEPLPVTFPDGDHHATRVEGARIDRILAVAGQKAHWTGGKLEVDGIPSELAPLNPASCGFRFETVVPKGHFLILPSSLNVPLSGIVTSQLGAICVIGESDIAGRVLLRNQPLSRFGWIR
jgi:hypothetical protein